MTFEKMILSKIAATLDFSDRAEFSAGTLFVKCSEDNAREIFHKLCDTVGIGKVQISKTPAEFAYDFIA